MKDKIIIIGIILILLIICIYLIYQKTKETFQGTTGNNNDNIVITFNERNGEQLTIEILNDSNFNNIVDMTLEDLRERILNKYCGNSQVCNYQNNNYESLIGYLYGNTPIIESFYAAGDHWDYCRVSAIDRPCKDFDEYDSNSIYCRASQEGYYRCITKDECNWAVNRDGTIPMNNCNPVTPERNIDGDHWRACKTTQPYCSGEDRIGRSIPGIKCRASHPGSFRCLTKDDCDWANRYDNEKNRTNIPPLHNCQAVNPNDGSPQNPPQQEEEEEEEQQQPPSENGINDSANQIQQYTIQNLNDKLSELINNSGIYIISISNPNNNFIIKLTDENNNMTYHNSRLDRIIPYDYSFGIIKLDGNNVVLWSETQLDSYSKNNAINITNETGEWNNVYIPPNTSIVIYDNIQSDSNKKFYNKPPFNKVLNSGKYNNQNLKNIRIVPGEITQSNYTRDKLCPSECMGSDVSNDRSNNYQNNYFTVHRHNQSTISVDNNNNNIGPYHNYSICGDFLTNNICSETKENNSIDCRTCNIPIQDKDSLGNDKFCPNICYNNIYSDKPNVMENDGNYIKVCNKYLTLDDKDKQGNNYYCHNENYTKDVDCTKCKISGNFTDRRNEGERYAKHDFIEPFENNLKNFMANPDTFINTDNKRENFQSSANIIGVILSSNSSTVDYIEENQINNNSLNKYIYFPQLNFYQNQNQKIDSNHDFINSARLQNVNEIRNISRNKLFGIYSFDTNNTIVRNTYPYNLPEFNENEKPNVVLGPGDKLIIQNNEAELNNTTINSRTLTTELTNDFHKSFPISLGFNIKKIKVINMPENCKLYNLDQNNCVNQVDTSGNNCRFIPSNKLANNNSGLDNSLLTQIEEEQSYNPLKEELNLYKTLEKNNSGQIYDNVGSLLQDRPQDNNFCFSLDVNNTNNPTPYSGVCSGNNSGETPAYPCVRITTKDTLGNTTNFVRHRDAVINELGAEIREFVLNNPGTIKQNIDTLNRIFEVNTEIKNEIEADQLIERQLLSSNQNELNNIRNNLLKEIQSNKDLEDELREATLSSSIEGFNNSNNKKPIRRIASNYNNENLTVMNNTDDSYGIKINEDCLAVYGDNEYKEVKCNNKASSQKFYEYKITNDSDAKIVMGKLPLTTSKKNYPYSVFKSGVTGNCLQNNDEGLSVQPCNPNTEKQKWAPFTDPYKCLDSR